MHKITDYPDASGEPLVSVCMITYNHRGFIAQAIDSVLMQQVNFTVEIIIHDDCSTDGTTAIVEDYARRFPKLIRPIFQTENQYSQGKKPYLTTFARARGKYLALLDGDDAWQDPLKLKMQVECLETNPEFVLCYGNISHIDDEGNILQESFICSDHCRELTRNELISCQYIISMGAVMLRNHPILKKMPANFFKVLNGDTFLFALLGQYGGAGFVNFKPTLYRQHSGGIYSSQDDLNRCKARLHTFLQLFLCLEKYNRHILAASIAGQYQATISLLRRKNKACQFFAFTTKFSFFSLLHRPINAWKQDAYEIFWQCRRFRQDKKEVQRNKSL